MSETSPTMTAAIPSDVMALQALVVEQNAVIARLNQQNETVIALLNEQLTKLRQELEWCKRQLFGRKSEKIDPSQPFFDALMIQAIETNPPADEAPKVETTVAAHTRKHTPHGRGELPAHLRREIEVVDVPAEQKVLPDGTDRPVIGHEDAERLAYTPAEFFVKVTRRPKYGSPAGAEENGVVIAPVPERLIPRCLADETLLAHVIVSKYADHLPLYRLESVFQRSDVKITRQTMWRWMKECGLALEPLKLAILTQLFATGLVHSDDTPVDLLEDDIEKPRGKQIRQARLWVATAAPRAGPWTVYDFTRSRATEGPESFFKNYKGRIVCDAYTIYDRLIERNAALELRGCWAHARRYFLEAHRTSHPREGAEFVAIIGRLYEIEREIVDADDATRLRVRRERSRPLLNEIHARIESLLPNTPPKSGLAKALAYANGIWPRLIAFVDDSQVGIDNNPAENAIRPIALGRKNWLFVGDYDAGRAAANLMSIIATCKRAGIDPFAYLCDMLVRIPSMKTTELATLLPGKWTPAAVKR